MSDFTTPSLKLRWSFAAALTASVLFGLWADHLQATHDPDPQWTEDLPQVVSGVVFGLFILLYPMPGMVGNLRRALLALFFGTAALAFFFFVKGL